MMVILTGADAERWSAKGLAGWHVPELAKGVPPKTHRLILKRRLLHRAAAGKRSPPDFAEWFDGRAYSVEIVWKDCADARRCAGLLVPALTSVRPLPAGRHRG
jgi:hypothetical protein